MTPLSDSSIHLHSSPILGRHCAHVKGKGADMSSLCLILIICALLFTYYYIYWEGTLLQYLWLHLEDYQYFHDCWQKNTGCLCPVSKATIDGSITVSTMSLLLKHHLFLLAWFQPMPLAPYPPLYFFIVPDYLYYNRGKGTAEQKMCRLVRLPIIKNFTAI